MAEFLGFLDFVQRPKPNNSECYTPSPEPFRFYLSSRYGPGIYPSCRKLEHLKLRTMDQVQEPSDSECYTPSSERFVIYIRSVYIQLLREVR
jgi:hypothetical protein